jgi:hypothetical protein
MAQHDYVIANGTGAAVRSDLNGGLAAIVSNNSGATEPGTMYAYQWWPDTTTGLLKQRNAANSGWITIGTLASANLGLLSLAGGTMTGALAVTAGTAALPGIAVSGDLNTGFWSPAADTLAASTAGTEQFRLSSSGNLSFNSGYGSVAVTYGCRAWVNFNGTGTVAIRASGNVSSITDNGVGDYTVNFTTAMPDVNYAICVGRANQALNVSCSTNIGYVSAPAVGSFRVGQYENGVLADIQAQYFAIFR